MMDVIAYSWYTTPPPPLTNKILTRNKKKMNGIMIIIDSWQSVKKKISLTVFDSPGEPRQMIFYCGLEEMGLENIVHRLWATWRSCTIGTNQISTRPHRKRKKNQSRLPVSLSSTVIT
jgi:hypothetical protein